MHPPPPRAMGCNRNGPDINTTTVGGRGGGLGGCVYRLSLPRHGGPEGGGGVWEMDIRDPPWAQANFRPPQQMWHSGPGDEVSAWLIVDYSKAHDSVRHPMMAALFKYICIPAPWLAVPMRILKGPVLCLVMGGVVREESLTPALGIRQGDPLSPILFSLLTFVICFVLRPYGAHIWVYPDDAFVRLTRREATIGDDLQSLLAEFKAFGECTGLRLNVEKTHLLLQGFTAPWVAGIKVVSHVRYLSTQFGHVSVLAAYDQPVALFESRCVQNSRMPLSRQQKVLLLHMWCYPVLQVTNVAHPPPDQVLKRLRRALVVAFRAQNGKVPWHVPHLSAAQGGIGLRLPEVYLWTTHEATFTRYLQQPTRYGLEAHDTFSTWLSSTGTVHTSSQLPLLQLSPCGIRNAPWLASSVKALSALNSLHKGLGLPWQEVAAAPLWNNRLVTMSEKSMMCKYLIRRGVLWVSNLVDPASRQAVVPQCWKGARKL